MCTIIGDAFDIDYDSFVFLQQVSRLSPHKKKLVSFASQKKLVSFVYFVLMFAGPLYLILQ